MATTIAILIALALMLLQLGGRAAGASSHSYRTGGTTIETREVSGFDAVELHTIGTLTVRQGTNASLTIEAEAAVPPLIENNVRGTTLVIGIKPNSTAATTLPINYSVTVKDLKALTRAAFGSIVAPDIKTRQLTAQSTGSGSIQLNRLGTDMLAASITGSGSCEISGTATRQNVQLNGAGGYQTRDLATDAGTMQVSGSGSATVRARNHLDANISGSGGIGYIRNPSVSQTLPGGGQLRQIR